jgi:tetratricopeptide (TPR) repeat protein
MGTWSHEAFGNDTACDWACGLEESADFSLVEEAIAAVLSNAKQYLDASLAEEGLAAIEVIARLRGHPGYNNAYTENVDVWVARTRIKPQQKLVKNALAALDAIAGDQSELQELWSEGDGARWLESIQDLRNRLRAEAIAIVMPQRVAPDKVAQVLSLLSSIQFKHVELPENPSVALLYSAVLASGALCDPSGTRKLIAQIWQPLAESENETVLWDLAVRDAQTWASQGSIEEALAQLDAWRHSPAVNTPGLYEYRATSVCLAGCDIDRARALYLRAIDAAPHDLPRQFDLALLEARLGSVERAQELLKQAGPGVQNLPRMFVALVEGIIACRLARPEALDLLTEATAAFAAASQQNLAAWSVLSFCGAWWALALGRVGKREQAVEVLRLTERIVMQPHNKDLVIALRDEGLLADDVAIPQFPVAAAPAESSISCSAELADHGGFKSFRIRGVNALRKVESLRLDFERGSGLYPFLIGDPEDLAQLLNLISPPQDDGRAHLAAAEGVDVAAWLKEKMPKPIKSWPRQAVPTVKTPLIQFDALSQRLKPELVIGLIRLDQPSELFSRIGFGDWNGCPAPYMHTALHGYWQQQFGAQPIVVSGDTVECVVASPPTEKAAALNLAREQHAYCADFVEQGVGTTARLGVSLFESKYWYFWWD